MILLPVAILGLLCIILVYACIPSRLKSKVRNLMSDQVDSDRLLREYDRSPRDSRSRGVHSHKLILEPTFEGDRTPRASVFDLMSGFVLYLLMAGLTVGVVLVILQSFGMPVDTIQAVAEAASTSPGTFEENLKAAGGAQDMHTSNLQGMGISADEIPALQRELFNFAPVFIVAALLFVVFGIRFFFRWLQAGASLNAPAIPVAMHSPNPRLKQENHSKERPYSNGRSHSKKEARSRSLVEISEDKMVFHTKNRSRSNQRGPRRGR